MTNPPPCTAMLARKFARRVSARYDEALKPHGLTIGQFGILAQLRRSRGQALGAVATLLGPDASTLSRLGRPLERAGLVTAEADPCDRRVRLLRLTDAGAARTRAAYAAWEAANADVATRLGADRVAALHADVGAATDQL